MIKWHRQSNTVAGRIRWATALFPIWIAFAGILAGCSKEPHHPIEKCNNTRNTAGEPQLLASGLQGSAGSTIGPDGALYVTEGAVGKISRIDPKTGAITTFTSGLPLSIIGIGGTWDLAFIGGTCYALVTLVGPDVQGTDVVGICRIDGPC